MTVEVVPSGGAWQVRVVGVPIATYERKKRAKEMAEREARRRSMRLEIRRGDGTYQTSKYRENPRFRDT